MSHLGGSLDEAGGRCWLLLANVSWGRRAKFLTTSPVSLHMLGWRKGDGSIILDAGWEVKRGFGRDLEEGMNSPR